MIYTIQNRCLTVQIEDLGAQLASIRDSQGREFLWQGSPASWPRRAPILFPSRRRPMTGKIGRASCRERVYREV